MIGDDIAAGLTDLRAQAESLMRATVTVSRISGTTTNTDGYEVPATASVYSGKARIVAPSTQRVALDVAGRQTTLQQPEVRLPVGAPVKLGDVVHVDANPDDPTLVGRDFRLSAQPSGSTSIQYRIPAEEVL